MDKLYRVQMNKHGMPNFSTAVEVEPNKGNDSDLIRRSDAIKAVMSKPAWHGSEGSWFHSDDIKNAINDIPAIEPKKVCIGQIHFDDEKLHEIVDEAMKKLKEEIEPKQGEWIFQECNDEIYGRAYECSICGVAVVGNHHHFCPNCGAKMKGAGDGRKMETL